MGCACVALRGVHGSLFVACEYVGDAVGVIIELVEDRYDVSARIAEYEVYVFGYQSADKSFGSGDFIAHKQIVFGSDTLW